MANYNNGKIYKIESINGEDGDIYIGSTTKEFLSQRMATYRSDYKRYLKGNYSNVRSFKLFEKYGVENCHIILLESVYANTKDELHAREAHYIKTLTCVNKCIPLQTDAEYRATHQAEIKQYKNTKCTCQCGGKFTTNHKAEHLKTTKHIKYQKKFKLFYIINYNNIKWNL